ncbi:hypothetical protein FGO68_gene7908 [Halteria grandinella]|uniref:Uncharacterized protein n=1 Tax=Halteria grandinella TaxID=5974 RepID=A0A8J8NCM2_HALGN|nr:hypothetical protein FGO68_gene7908 [Halteria grandinella]
MDSHRDRILTRGALGYCTMVLPRGEFCGGIDSVRGIDHSTEHAKLCVHNRCNERCIRDSTELLQGCRHWGSAQQNFAGAQQYRVGHQGDVHTKLKRKEQMGRGR